MRRGTGARSCAPPGGPELAVETRTGRDAYPVPQPIPQAGRTAHSSQPGLPTKEVKLERWEAGASLIVSP